MDINQANAVRNVLLELKPDLNAIKVLRQSDRKLIHQAAKAFEKQSQSKSSQLDKEELEYDFVERLRNNLMHIERDTNPSSGSNPLMRLIKGIANLFHLRVSSEQVDSDIGTLRTLPENIKDVYRNEALIVGQTKAALAAYRKLPPKIQNQLSRLLGALCIDESNLEQPVRQWNASQKRGDKSYSEGEEGKKMILIQLLLDRADSETIIEQLERFRSPINSSAREIFDALKDEEASKENYNKLLGLDFSGIDELRSGLERLYENFDALDPTPRFHLEGLGNDVLLYRIRIARIDSESQTDNANKSQKPNIADQVDKAEEGVKNFNQLPPELQDKVKRALRLEVIDFGNFMDQIIWMESTDKNRDEEVQSLRRSLIELILGEGTHRKVENQADLLLPPSEVYPQRAGEMFEVYSTRWGIKDQTEFNDYFGLSTLTEEELRERCEKHDELTLPQQIQLRDLLVESMEDDSLWI